jgi:outer membrane protein OmpA-like peptidoglycan-associated protein
VEKYKILCGGAADLSESDPGAISAYRAEAVKDFLVSKGIPGDRILTTAYGSSWARVATSTNTSGAPEPKNRRVQISIVPERSK